MAVDKVVNVIAVWHAFVPAAGTVHVATLVSCAGMIGRARRGVLGVAFQDVLVNVIAVHVMQMTVVQIVGVAVVFEGDVSTSRPVGVRMVFVLLARHFRLLSQFADNSTESRC